MSGGAFYRPCWLAINREALQRNFHAIKSRLSTRTSILAVVKADGYGHGLVRCAKVADQEGAALLGVSSLEEGIALRQARVRTPTLVLGSLFPFENFPVLFHYRLTPTIASRDAAIALDRLARRRGRRIAVHLKIDSGFGRIGVQAGSGGRAVAFVREVAKRKGLLLEGLYTQFSSADVDAAYTRRQHAAFQDVVAAVRQEGIQPRWVHEANSSALLRFPEAHGSLVRPGIAIYGIAPFRGAERMIRLEPALEWKTRVIYLKTIPAGFRVSYAQTWTARRPTRVATLAVGYADGYPRHLSNKGVVLLRGRRAPVIGRVTMDMMMVDATDVPAVDAGDEAVLIGRQGRERITATELAGLAETNAYELVSRIAARVPRLEGSVS